MDVNYEDIGRRIRKARLAKGLTQEQLAEKIEVGVTHLSHIETGNTIPSMKVFIAIVNTLDVSADALLCDNLNHARDAFTGEMAEILASCNEIEVRVIADISKALKESIRRRL